MKVRGKNGRFRASRLGTVPLIAAALIVASPLASLEEEAGTGIAPIPDKTVVLTFDDAVKSHRTFVGPLLKEMGFGASFFVTRQWMEDRENFMSWDDIADLHGMGFEIGNHTWNHGNYGDPKNASKLLENLRRVEQALTKVGVPRPVSFAWPGNAFGPGSLEVLRDAGYMFARRGTQPEVPYHEMAVGPVYRRRIHDRLLIPTTGDAFGEWTLEHFEKVIARARAGGIAVLQFHGVPDVAHPWVHTAPEMFRKFMQRLKDGGYNVIALRDLSNYVDMDAPVDDPMTRRSHPEPG